MNNLFFFDQDDPPRPPADTRIVKLTAAPYPDGGRVRMEITLTPFEERPNLEIFARKVDGPIVAEVSVIETMTPRLEFTLHLRGEEALPGDYTLRAELYYEDRRQPQDIREISFTIGPDAPATSDPEQKAAPPG